MKRCCHRPGQCHLPDKEFRYLRHVVSLMSPSRSDYIFTAQGERVWRVVSEDSSNHLRLRSLSLLAVHIHLVGLSTISIIPCGSRCLLRSLASTHSRNSW